MSDLMATIDEKERKLDSLCDIGDDIEVALIRQVFRALRIAIEAHKENVWLGKPTGECGVCVEDCDSQGNRHFESFPCEFLKNIAKELGVEE